MEKVSIKNKSEIKKMIEGGKKLARVKKSLANKIAAGVNAADIEKEAERLIEKEGGEASFKMVPGYYWATCVNVNEGLVHGIPKAEIVFKKGDVVSVDVGMYYKGFHTDTSFTVGVEASPEIEKFLTMGRSALQNAIDKARVGNRIYDISSAIEDTLKAGGATPIRALVGHGVGRALHEEPQIPCFTQGARERSSLISPGMVLAIEVMYAQGTPDVVTLPDGWTISMADGKISALFEETVAITKHGPLILTGDKYAKN